MTLRTLARSLAVALAAVAAVAASGCRSTAGTAGPSRIAGRVVADRLPPDARIEVYRADVEGPAVPVPGNVATLDTLGRFQTAPVLPGRYVIVLRTAEAPPSTTTAIVPGRTDVELRVAPAARGTTVVLESPGSAPGVRRLRITSDAAVRGVPDVREVTLAAGGSVRVEGLTPGLWHVDVLPDGATADFVVPSGEIVQRWILDPPAAPGIGSALEGSVLRLAGEPAVGSVVTARPCTAAGDTVEAWGRFAAVDREGRYRIDRLPAGTVLVRVERREASYARVPSPELIVISPSRVAERGYTVEP